MIRRGPDYEISSRRSNTMPSAIYGFLDKAMFVNLSASVDRVLDAKSTQLVSAITSKDNEDVVPADLRTEVDGVSAAARDEATEQASIDLGYVK